MSGAGTADMGIRIRANDYKTGALTEITVDGGRIRSVRRLADGPAAEAPWVCPGFIDVQVNGFGGFNLNGGEVDRHTLPGMLGALAAHGVTSCMPTIITASNEDMSRSIKAIRQACEDDAETDAAVAGIHLEGPYLSAEPGFRGAHPPGEMRDPDEREFLAWQTESGGRIRKMTLAPERAGAIAFIRFLRRQGVIAAIGHSDASSGQIAEAVEAGLAMCTHLGNGIRHMLPRHAACVWDLLAARGLYAGFIADGHHLPRSVVETIVAMKGDKAVLVSDAVHLAGLAPGRYGTHIGGDVELLPDGRLQLASDPNVLAGSAMSMLDGVNYLLKLYPDNAAGVIDMATANPAALLGAADRGRLAEGSRADLIVYTLSRDGRMEIGEVWRHGCCVYRR